MARNLSIAILAAIVLSAAAVMTNPVGATPLGAATKAQLFDEAMDPVTNVRWWRRHHRPFFVRFHHRRFFHRRAYFVRFHHRRHCWSWRWC